MNILNKSKIATVFLGGFLCGVTYLISCGKVNTNEAGASGTTTRYVKANGTSVGEFLSLTNFEKSDESNIVVITSSGYLLPIMRTGDVLGGDIYYTSALCAGTPYTQVGVQKSILRTGASLFYISSTATNVASIAALSWRPKFGNPSGDCFSTSGTVIDVMPLTTNDSAVTGVSQTSFTPPITIE